MNLIGLTILTTNGHPLVAPKLNRRRALLVLSKIDEILAWEKNSAQERDVRFVDLGRYLSRRGVILFESGGADRGLGNADGDQAVTTGIGLKARGDLDIIAEYVGDRSPVLVLR